jgi:hypothetical protein
MTKSKKTVDDLAYWDEVEKLRLAKKSSITYAQWKKKQATNIKLKLKKSVMDKSVYKHGNHYTFLFKPFLQYATAYLKIKKQPNQDPSDALLLFLKKQHKNGKYYSTKKHKFVRYKYN